MSVELLYNLLLLCELLNAHTSLNGRFLTKVCLFNTYRTQLHGHGRAQNRK